MQAWLPSTLAGILVLAGLAVVMIKALSIIARTMSLFGLAAIAIAVWARPDFVNGVVNGVLGIN